MYHSIYSLGPELILNFKLFIHYFSFWVMLQPHEWSIQIYIKTEPDWEKPNYIGPVLDICQL